MRCQITISGSQCNQGSRERFRAISLHFRARYFPHCRSRDGFPDSRLGRISRFPDLISGISRAAVGAFLTLRPRPVWPAGGPAALAKPHFTPHCRVQSALLHSVHCCTSSSPECTPAHYTAWASYSALHTSFSQAAFHCTAAHQQCTAHQHFTAHCTSAFHCTLHISTMCTLVAALHCTTHQHYIALHCF